MTKTLKKLAAGVLVACSLCLALVPGAAWAAVDPEAALQKVDGSDDVAVFIKLPEGARDDVRTLRLTLTVKGDDLDEVKADFVFDGSLDDVAVKDARYRHEGGEGVVNLYLAGNVNLFANDTLELGSVHLTGEEGTTVEIGVGPLSVVNTAHDTSDPVVYSQGSVPVEIGAESTTPNPPEPPAGEGEDDKPGSGDNPGSGEGSGSGEGTGTGSGNGGAGSGDGSTNTSPGAPTGTDQSLVTTGDDFASSLAVWGTMALVAAAVVSLGLVRLSKRD